MKLYLKLSQDSWLARDFGSTISGEVYEDRARTVGHDLTGYTSVHLHLFNRGDLFSYFNSPTIVGTGQGNEHRWSYVVQKGDFLNAGVYSMNVTLRGTGIIHSTESEEFHIKSNGARDETFE